MKKNVATASDWKNMVFAEKMFDLGQFARFVYAFMESQLRLMDTIVRFLAPSYVQVLWK